MTDLSGGPQKSSRDIRTSCSGTLPWLTDFEENDYTRLWESKRIEDEAQKRIIRGWVRPGDSCLDLGGGFGRITRVLEPFFREVTLIDLTRRNLRMAKGNLSKAEVIRGSVSSIPAKDASFDLVTMIRVVHLLPDPLRTMKEILRVSKNGGTVIISVPNLVTGHLVRQFERRFSRKLEHLIPTFGPAVWPIGERPYLSPHKLFVPNEFKLKARRGTGLFDNFVGQTLNAVPGLHLLDVATSPLWFFKLDVFFRFEIRKVEGSKPGRSGSAHHS